MAKQHGPGTMNNNQSTQSIEQQSGRNEATGHTGDPRSVSKKKSGK